MRRILAAALLTLLTAAVHAQDTLCRNAAAGQVDGVPCFPLDGRFYRAGPNDGIELDAIKGTVVADVTGTANTLTIHFADGTTEDVTVVEDGVLSLVSFSAATKTLTFTIDDGTTINVSLGDFRTAAEVTAEIASATAGHLSESEVDDRIAPYARATPTGTMDDAQIPADIARDLEVDAAVADRLTGTEVDSRIASGALQPGDITCGANVSCSTSADGIAISATGGSGGGAVADGVVFDGALNNQQLELQRTESLSDVDIDLSAFTTSAEVTTAITSGALQPADILEGANVTITRTPDGVTIAASGGGTADGRVDGLVSKTADLSVDVIGRTWANVGAVADGGFYWRSAIPTLAQAAALDSSYVVSVTPSASQATNFYTLLRIPDGHDSRDFRVRQSGDLGTFDTTGWHLIGSQGGFDYHYAQRNLFEGYTVRLQESVTQTTTHFRGESDAENVTVDAANFGGNIEPTVTDMQAFADAVDDLTLGGNGASVTNDTILFGAPENESETVAPSRHAVAIMGEVLDFRTPDSTGTTGHVWTKTATEGEWAAVDAVDIAAYSSSATYERGSRNSIVTHANHVWVYVSTQRNTNHDPEQFPQYWWKIDTPIRVLNHDSATTTHWRSGEFFLTETGELRMATATISASPADIIADHTGADQEFLWLNEPAPISWGFQIDTLIVPELNQDAITDARIILEDSGLTHYLTFLDWTAANLNSISHLPVGAHIGLRQGVTTRILEVEAEWDATNDRYQVINVNTGILSESASGTATELLLTSGAGDAGFTLHVGAGAPANSLGDDGDWYLRTSNGQWYEKASGAWASRYIDQVGQAGTGLTAVSTETSLTGDGTSSDPLDIADGGVDTANLADDAVTGAKIADDTIHGGALIDGTIATIKIGNAQVTGDKLSNNAVSTGKVADNAITTAKIAAGAVGSSDIASFAVLASKLNSNAVTTAKVADAAITTAKLAANAAGEGKVPIDNTLEFDGSGDLGVQISTVIDLLDEDIRYYSTDTTREDARQASKGIVFLDTSRYAKRIHSVEWDFEGDGVGHNYTTFFVRIDEDDDIDFVYGESETLFNVGTSGTHRTNFDSSGLRIPGSVERLGLFLTRTGSDDTWETKVYRGQPASDSPRQSYPDATTDFPFWRSARFASGRPEPGEHIDNYITNGEIYGYPKIRYTLELEHASLVGDGNITPAHIDSGSATDGWCADLPTEARGRPSRCCPKV